MKKFITIILPVYNGERFIADALESIKKQNRNDMEVIVVDGKSIDNTLNIVRKYESLVSHLISESDFGIYDAINKGLTLATGEWIGVLNCDDWYSDGVFNYLEKIAENIDFIYGSVSVHWNTGITTQRPLKQTLWKKRAIQEMVAPHISFFIRKKAYRVLNGYDLLYKICADQDFVYRLIRSGFRGQEIPQIMGHVRPGGISNINSEYNREYLISALLKGKSPLQAYLKYIITELKVRTLRFIPHKIKKIIMIIIRSRHR